MDNTIAVNDQVRFKQKLHNCSSIRFGKVISLTDKETAIVSVQDDPRKPKTLQASARLEIPLKDLEPTKKLFGGRAVVQANPLHRTIGSLLK